MLVLRNRRRSRTSHFGAAEDGSVRSVGGGGEKGQGDKREGWEGKGFMEGKRREGVKAPTNHLNFSYVKSLALFTFLFWPGKFWSSWVVSVRLSSSRR